MSNFFSRGGECGRKRRAELARGWECERFLERAELAGLGATRGKNRDEPLRLHERGERDERGRERGRERVRRREVVCYAGVQCREDVDACGRCERMNEGTWRERDGPRSAQSFTEIEGPARALPL